MRLWMCIKAWSPKYNSQELISTTWLPSEMVARLHFPEKLQGYWCLLAKIQVLVAKRIDQTDRPRASAGVWGSNSADTPLAEALPAINEI